MSVPEALIEQSSLTRRQIESLLSYRRVASGELKLKEAASLMSEGRTKGSSGREISVGSYYRTVNQARDNVRESLVSVLVALWLGLVRLEDVRRLFELVGSGARELSEEEENRFVELLQVLLNRIIV